MLSMTPLISNSKNPIVSPASLSGYANCIQRGFVLADSHMNLAESVVPQEVQNVFQTIICAIRSATVGMPSMRVPPDFFGIGIAITEGGNNFQMRHTIPKLILNCHEDLFQNLLAIVDQYQQPQ